MGLIGWASGTSWLTTLVPALPPMVPNTAVALLLLGGAAAARQARHVGPAHRAVTLVLALAALTISVGTLAELALAIDLPVLRAAQTMIARPVAGFEPVPMSPFTAVAVTLLAVGLLLLGAGSTAPVRPSELLVLCAAFTAFTSLSGMILGAAPLYRLTRPTVIGMSLPTAVSLLLTSIGLLSGPARGGIIRVATSNGPGGRLTRLLGLPTVVGPLLLGFAVARIAAMQGIADITVPIAILTVATTMIGLVLLLVTARPLNRAHQAVAASRARIAELVEHAPDGIFVANLEGRYTDVNDAGCRLLGYSRDEIVGKTIVDLIPEEDVERLWRVREGLVRGAVEVSEWKLRRRDGIYVPVEVSAKVLPDGRWQGFVRDISERKRLQQEAERAWTALCVSEAKATGILAISADAIISIDSEQRITQFNEGAEKIFGYPKTEALGAPLEMLIPERFRAAHRLHVTGFGNSADAARKMGTRDAPIVGLRKGGREFPADAAISKLDVGGTRVLTAIVRDFTEQKHIEDEQRLFAEVGAVLASTLDYDEIAARVAKVAVQRFAYCCMVDLIDETGRMRRLSSASRHRSRTELCDVLGRVPRETSRPLLLESVFGSARPLLIRRPTRNDVTALAYGQEHVDALGTIDFELLMVVPLRARGRLLGAISFLSSALYSLEPDADLRIAQDIAQRVAFAVDNARLYSEAQRATRVRDDVLGIVAHDLRNPLSMILVEATLLAAGDGPHAVNWNKSLEQIQRAAMRMNRLIQDLLEVTRMEAGRLTVEPRTISAGQIAADAAAAQRVLASASALELRLEVAPQLPDVRGDRDRLLQVFENLVGNAIKFTPKGGCITIGAARQEASVRFWVSDTGPGIPAGDQPHLFDRFWQARSAKGGGAGLGLPIVKGIIEAHGGRVWVESAPGKGATFAFTIPTAQIHEGSATHAANGPAPV
jgi:PAS domain S-box-containing protein